MDEWKLLEKMSPTHRCCVPGENAELGENDTAPSAYSGVLCRTWTWLGFRSNVVKV